MVLLKRLQKLTKALRLTSLILVYFVLKTQYNNDKSIRPRTLMKKLPGNSELVKKQITMLTITEIEGKIRIISDLATTAAFNAGKNKIPIVSNLVKKIGYDTKTSNIEAKYFTTCDYKKFTCEIINSKIKKIVNKSDISGFTDKS